MGPDVRLPRLRGTSRVIRYPVGDSGQTLVLSESVVGHLLRHRQMTGRDREAGGQLFARRSGDDLLVEEATGPRPQDRRGRFSYVPDRKAEQTEIDTRFSAELIWIGDWHTHPQARPTPSPTDLANIGECFRRSTHRLNALLLIVVGTDAPPEGLHVSLHDGRVARELIAESLTQDTPARTGQGPLR